MRKWRPSITQVVLGVMAVTLLLPLTGVGLLRLVENQLIAATESELVAQSAAIAAATSLLLDAAETTAREPDDTVIAMQRARTRAPALAFRKSAPRPLPSTRALRRPAPQVESSADKAAEAIRVEPAAPPLEDTAYTPALRLGSSPVLDTRQAPSSTGTAPDMSLAAIRPALDKLLQRTQAVTLAGFRILDANGIAVAGRGDIGLSFAGIEEVSTALAGTATARLRRREIDNPQPIHTISRGTTVRVFTALPILREGRVAGVVYASRTPSNVWKELYQRRGRVAVAALIVVALALLIGLVLSRFLRAPVVQLADRVARIGRGERDATAPLARYGTREVSRLADGVFETAERLFARSRYIETFAVHVQHELKTPLTAIAGAVELLSQQGETMRPEQRQKFLANITADTQRMTHLLDRLRDLAHADNINVEGTCDLRAIAEQAARATPQLAVTVEGDATLQLGAEAADIILSNLFDNAARHGATALTITATGNTISIRDDGPGITAGNADKLFEPFFTTRRESGGTGLGLAIIRAVVEAHGGTIVHVAGNGGAHFEIARLSQPVAKAKAGV